jgi:hypothetical protein
MRPKGGEEQTRGRSRPIRRKGAKK